MSLRKCLKSFFIFGLIEAVAVLCTFQTAMNYYGFKYHSLTFTRGREIIKGNDDFKYD